ncbi:putative nicotinate phosphoribosyltransferase [Mycobacterium xenopi 4042]|uniref:Putative nicotinate phosphoribosyltransferase n=1 Tax=Mycobacterium xenopi 4042 TaxID=1299334 RepID=X8CIZ0_MYCXE|nr:putative nicotinate phosphoribosyltransferase [Mycobacterium xenopi 4042]
MPNASCWKPWRCRFQPRQRHRISGRAHGQRRPERPVIEMARDEPTSRPRCRRPRGLHRRFALRRTCRPNANTRTGGRHRRARVHLLHTHPDGPDELPPSAPKSTRWRWTTLLVDTYDVTTGVANGAAAGTALAGSVSTPASWRAGPPGARTA